MKKLLQEHFGNDWKTRNNVEFYKDVLSRTIRMDENFEDIDEVEIRRVFYAMNFCIIFTFHFFYKVFLEMPFSLRYNMILSSFYFQNCVYPIEFVPNLIDDCIQYFAAKLTLSNFYYRITPKRIYKCIIPLKGKFSDVYSMFC